VKRIRIAPASRCWGHKKMMIRMKKRRKREEKKREREKKSHPPTTTTSRGIRRGYCDGLSFKKSFAPLMINFRLIKKKPTDI
jgi:hypothetical protein